MAQEASIEQPNKRYWMGPNAAGMGKATVPPPNAEGLHSDGTQQTVYHGRNHVGSAKDQTGPNVAGAPKSVNNV